MNDLTEFEIQLESPWKNYSNPPEDPLNELTPLELGMWRFCYENNRRVSIQFGKKKEFVFLENDFSIVLPELPVIITNLLRGISTELDFAESHFYIKFEIAGDKINGSIVKSGVQPEEWKYEFDRFQIIKVLKRFLIEIVCMAVDGNYISPEEANEFLADLNTPI